MNLKQKREAANLTQEQLAQKADCSLASVRMLENGYQPKGPSEVRERIVKVLGGAK